MSFNSFSCILNKYLINKDYKIMVKILTEKQIMTSAITETQRADVSSDINKNNTLR